MKTAEEWIIFHGIENRIGEHEIPAALLTAKDIREIQVDAMYYAAQHPVSYLNRIQKLREEINQED